MPSDPDLQSQAEEWKKKGNDAFAKSDVETAIQAYSQGLVQLDRMVTSPPPVLKATILSNRAACFLKTPKLQECVDDCTLALNLLEASNLSDPKLRGKLLYRRAKARYLNFNMPLRAKNDQDLHLAAKDLLDLLNFDSTNKDATILLNTIRAQHATETKNQSSSPMAKTLDGLKQRDDKAVHHAKVLLGLLTNDIASASMELGRLDGVSALVTIVDDGEAGSDLRRLALQCIACAAIHPPFCRKYCSDLQSKACNAWIVPIVKNPAEDDLVVSALALLLRCILHLDRDDPNEEVSGKTLLDYDSISKSLVAALNSSNIKLIRASLDVLTSWTAGRDRESMIRASLDHCEDLPQELTQEQLRQLKPKDLSDYRSRRRELTTRDRAWAFERSILFCRQGGLDAILQCTIACDDFSLRRELTVVLGKLFGAMDEMERIQEIVKPYLGTKDNAEKNNDATPKIEELPEDYEEKEGEVQDIPTSHVSLSQKMERAILASSLLLATPEVGAWSIGQGWPTCREDMEDLVQSNQKIPMCLAGEVLAAAASVKDTRPVVATLLEADSLKLLVSNSDRDIRSAAASAVAKLGLAEKGADDIELIHLLEAACHMLEDNDDAKQEDSDKLVKSKLGASKTSATTSVERGVEVLTYLASKTAIKNEIAHGFQATEDSKKTCLELLVDVANMPNAGESLMAFGLASIFQLLAVTTLTLRREAFEGKEVSMEEYDQIQNMKKTEEEKELEKDKPEDDDTKENCTERIHFMADANVPRALVQLIEGATDQTLEQTLVALNRMASEPSVRGTMIQQGVLSALIKLDKEEKNPPDAKKKIIRTARHCLAKLLVTTNPNLLTAAQRLGSIKPLIQLVRDIHGKDLQHFEALMALTNIASSGEDAKNKIVAEKGISSLNFAMFSEHHMVKRAATEAMCNLVPHDAMLKHLQDFDTMRLWLALASDYEDPDNYECARAAAGGLAMATQDPDIASVIITVPSFKERIDTILQSGRPEMMHRVLVILLNLVELGGDMKEAVIKHGMLAFCEGYVDSFHSESKTRELDFTPEERSIFEVTLDLAKQVVRAGKK